MSQFMMIVAIPKKTKPQKNSHLTLIHCFSLAHPSQRAKVRHAELLSLI